MTTSLLFVELIIIGLQAMVWLGLLAFSYASIGNLLACLKDIDGALTVLILGFSYTLGLLVDRLADALYAPWNDRLKKKIIPNPAPNIGTMRYQIDKENTPLNQFLEYTRSRMRIARATSLNMLMILISAVIYMKEKTALSPFEIVPTVFLILGLFLAVAFVWAWRNLTIRHLELIKTTHRPGG